MVNSSALISLGADFAYFFSSVTSKRGVISLGIRMMAFFLVAFNSIPILAVIALIGLGPALSTAGVILSIAAGFFLILGYFLMFKALSTEQLTSAVAMTAIWPAMVGILGVFFLGESVSGIQILGILLVFGGIFFIATTEKLKINRKLIPAVLANMSWGIYWITMTYVINTSGSFTAPLIITRIVMLVLLFAYILYAKGYKDDVKALMSKVVNKPSRPLMIACVAGIIYSFGTGTGDTIIASVINMKSEAIAAAIAALNPLFTAVVAYFLYKDRLTKFQYAGFAAMLIGAVTLAVS